MSASSVCSLCRDLGYRYQGGRKDPCPNQGCKARSDYLAYISSPKANHDSVMRTKARMALQGALAAYRDTGTTFALSMSIRAAYRAGLTTDNIRNLTGLPASAIQRLREGQTTIHD